MVNNLSPQMCRVLTLLAEGNTPKEVGVILGIKRQSVRRYAYIAMKRLEARTVVQAVVKFQVNNER